MAKVYERGDNLVVNRKNTIVYGNGARLEASGCWAIGNGAIVRAPGCRVIGNGADIEADDIVIEGNDNEYLGNRITILSGKGNKRKERPMTPEEESNRKKSRKIETINGKQYQFVYDPELFSFEIFSDSPDSTSSGPLVRLKSGETRDLEGVKVSFDINGKLEIFDGAHPNPIRKNRRIAPSSLPPPAPLPKSSSHGKVPPPRLNERLLSLNAPPELFCIECKARRRVIQLKPCDDTPWCVECTRECFSNTDSEDFECPVCFTKVEAWEELPTPNDGF